MGGQLLTLEETWMCSLPWNRAGVFRVYGGLGFLHLWGCEVARNPNTQNMLKALNPEEPF